MKSVFSHHGVPEVVHSDSGPQFSAAEFARFANSFGFQHVTSSPLYAQSNSQVERMVQTVKKMILKFDDTYRAMMSYKSTPHPWCNLSPAELLVGRRMRTTILQTKESLTPNWSYIPARVPWEKWEVQGKSKDSLTEDTGVKEQTSISDDTDIWVTSESQPIPCRVISHANNFWGATKKSYSPQCWSRTATTNDNGTSSNAHTS